MQTFAMIHDGLVAEIIEIPAGEPPLEERFHPDIVAACVPATAKVQEGWLYDGSTFKAPSPPSQPEVPRRTLKSDVWRRANEAEATAMDQMLNAAPVKLRRLWSDSTILDHASEEWAAVRDPLVKAFGQKRADEILAPSPGV